MAYNFSNLKEGTKNIEEWFKKECSQIRTGRANPVILDSVSVESYGAKLPINQVASVMTEDARSIRISPWDMSQSKAIEKAINAANLGLSIMVNEKGILVMFPELTSERRTSLIKVLGQKLEEAKVSIRAEREKCWNDIQDREKKGELTEDDKFRLKTEMQKMIDEQNKRLDEMAVKKEKEIAG